MLYSKNHLWADISGNIASIGITKIGQQKLGEIVFVNLIDVGHIIGINQKFGDIESIKTVYDLLSIADGRIIAINDDIIMDPCRLNEDPEKNWLVKIEFTKLSDELSDLENQNG